MPLLSWPMAIAFRSRPCLMTIAIDFGASLAAATLLATGYSFVYGVAQPIFGVVSDRVSRVVVLRVALLGAGLANIVSATASTLGVLISAKAMTAGFAAAILPTSLVYVGDQVPLDRRHEVIANVLAAGAAGTVLATVWAGLADRFPSCRLVFLVPAAVMLALGIGLRRLPESLSGDRGADRSQRLDECSPAVGLRSSSSWRWGKAPCSGC